MPTFEDKIVQRAVAWLLGAIYEQDFYECSYGFREGCDQHQALHALREQCLALNIRWIVDADVSGFFDTIDHRRLMEFIRRRINDGGIVRLIGQWLKAGVLEGDILTHPEHGTPQGGVISPLLANIFPSLRAGRVVRARSQTKDERAMLPNSVCRWHAGTGVRLMG